MKEQQCEFAKDVHDAKHRCPEDAVTMIGGRFLCKIHGQRIADQPTTERIPYQPCPFCGSEDIVYQFGCSQVYLYCRGCEAEGPKHPQAADPYCDIDVAEAVWNQRNVIPTQLWD